MARRRRKRNHDIDALGKLIVVSVFLISFLVTKNLQATITLGIFILILGGIVIGSVIFLRRAYQQAGLNSVQHSPSAKRSSINSSTDKIDQEFERQFRASLTHTDEKPTSWSLELIRKLDWKRFEELCAAYFLAKGRNAKVTELGADGGIDVLLFGDNNPNKVLGVVQCKAWTQKSVGVKEIRELLGIMTDAGCPLGVYMTTSNYTADAKAFSKGKHIKLVDAPKLLSLINELPLTSQAELLIKTTAGDYTTPTCPSCGIKLVSRTSRKSNSSGQSFWGCHNFPGCRYTMSKPKSA